MTSMIFGAGVQGASEAALTRIQSTVGSCAFGRLGGASLTLNFLLSGLRDFDPVFALTLAPLKAWATEIWTGKADVLRKMAIAFAASVKVLEDGGKLEVRAPGPTISVLLALRRLGWRAESFQTWVTDRGVVLPLRETCPRSLEVLGRLAAERWQWRHLAEQYPDEFEGFEQGGDAQPLQKALGAKSPLTKPQRQLLKCAAIRRLWPEHRRAAEGYQGSGLCGACGDEEGTIRHALYRCPAINMTRYCRDLGAVGNVGARSAAEHHLFSRGLLADIRHEAPPPCRRREVCWDPKSKKGVFEGHVFLDGSRLHGDDVRLARAGWGIAEVRVVGQFEARAWGPYVGVVQCIDAAEVYAAVMAMKLGAPPLHLYSDSEFFVRGWRKGRQWCEAPGRAHADVWRQFWMVLADFGGEHVLTVKKVKAHATQAMIDGNLISEVDAWGNKMADEAAKLGSACHPDVTEFLKKFKVRRLTSTVCAQWLGVGLQAAQAAGALPAELTSAQKMERPRQGALRRIEVVRDEVWRREQFGLRVADGVHPSHSLHKLGELFFCSVCGCYGSQKLVSLASPCEHVATPSRRYLLKRMLAGCHPRTGEYLGAAARAKRVAAHPLTASRRRSHSA